MKIALQLWTIRDHTERDMLGALREVARIGYRAVEFAGFGAADVADIRRTLDDLGMEPISAHISLEHLVEHPAHVVEQMHTLGCRRVVVPWIPPEHRTPLERVKRFAETCNALGATFAAVGIEFVYHNEDYDFLPLAGSTLWQTVVEHTESTLVKLQLDVFTSILMNADPLALMRAYGARMTSLHICDMHNRTYVPVGSGSLPWQLILNAARATAAEWLIVEQDGSPRSLDDAATSLSYLGPMING